MSKVRVRFIYSNRPKPRAAAMSPKTYTLDQLRALIRSRCDARGQKLVALEMGISDPYLSDFLRDKRTPGEKFLKTLGLRAVTIYVEVEHG